MKRIKEVIKYRFDEFLSKGTAALVFSLFIITSITVVLTGVLLFYVGNSDSGVSTLIWKSLMRTLASSNLAADSGTLIEMILLTFATIVGIFITSLLISFISTGFQAKLINLQRGKSKIIESGHLLILGWNDNTSIILSQLLIVNETSQNPVIVILASTDSKDILSELKEKNIDSKDTKIIIRTGSISNVTDLRMCNVSEARSVIISDDDDFETIKSLIAITNTDFFNKNEDSYITTILTNRNSVLPANLVGKDRVEIIYLKDAMTRIMAQSALQPGLSYIYNNLMSYEGDEIYIYDNLWGVTDSFYSETFNFEDASLIGVLRKGVPMIPPPLEEKIKLDDELIFISSGLKPKREYKKLVVNHLLDEVENSVSNKHQEHILIIGYNNRVKRVVEQLNLYVLKDSKITLVHKSGNDLSRIKETMDNYKNLTLNFKEVKKYNMEVLEKLEISAYTSIILLSDELCAGEEADSNTFLSLIQLRELNRRSTKNTPIITEIQSIKNAQIIEIVKPDDFIISKITANKMLAQVSEKRILKNIFDYLLDDDGYEIYMKKIENYVPFNIPVNGYDLLKSSLKKNEVMIGYKVSNIKDNDGIVINPNKNDIVEFKKGDHIIVLAEE